MRRDPIASAATPDARRAVAKAMVDSQAEACRLRYITAGDGKAATYLLKAAEADRLATDPDPDPANYPTLAPEAEALGLSLPEHGAVVRAKAAAWRSVAGQIEALTVTAKAAVDTLPDDAPASDYWTIVAGIAWPRPA